MRMKIINELKEFLSDKVVFLSAVKNEDHALDFKNTIQLIKEVYELGLDYLILLGNYDYDEISLAVKFETNKEYKELIKLARKYKQVEILVVNTRGDAYLLDVSTFKKGMRFNKVVFSDDISSYFSIYRGIKFQYTEE